MITYLAVQSARLFHIVILYMECLKQFSNWKAIFAIININDIYIFFFTNDEY